VEPAGAAQNASTTLINTATQGAGLLTLNTTGNATINLTAKAGGAAAGAEGQGTKNLVIVDGTTEGVSYNASTDTITATVNITAGGHNTAADLANVLNSSTAFAATVVSNGIDTIAATNMGTASLNGGQDAGSDTLSGANVLGNDVVITARDGTKLYVDIGDANPKGIAPGRYATLAVQDNGTGIPASIRHRVFEPFFTTKEEGHGSGLGLAMVCRFIRQSGGHITIDSEEGRGTTMRMYLPQAGTL